MKVLAKPFMALLALSLSSGSALAGENEKAEGKSKKPVIKVLGGGFSEEKLKKLIEDEDLPPEVAKALSAAIGSVSKKEGNDAPEAKKGGIIKLWEGGGVGDIKWMFGDDTDLSEDLKGPLAEMLKKAHKGEMAVGGFGIVGKGVVIGPDGVRKEFDLDEGSIDLTELLGGGRIAREGDLPGPLKMLLKKHGVEKTDKPDESDEDDNADVAKSLEDISKQLDKQTRLLEKLIEKLDQ